MRLGEGVLIFIFPFPLNMGAGSEGLVSVRRCEDIPRTVDREK